MGELIVHNFSLKHTLESGQFFRYYLLNDWYYIVSRRRVFKVRQEHDNILSFEGECDPKFITKFFGIDDELEEMFEFAKVKGLNKFTEKYQGLRIMNQDPWECLVAFVCSSASNVKKIQMNLNLMSQFFGKKILFDHKTFYTFPNPGELNDLAKLKEAKTGYRANYLFQINNMVKPTMLKTLGMVKYKKAKEMLCELPGVGEKIADCVLLFSLSHKRAFPVDVWIKRVMENLYFSGEKTSIKKIRDFAEQEFGEHSGYIQQYLYHYGRLGGK
jgi:N-glycosylase/DNA lyase